MVINADWVPDSRIESAKQMNYFQMKNVPQEWFDVFLSALQRGGVDVVSHINRARTCRTPSLISIHSKKCICSFLYMLPDVILADKVGEIIKIQPFILRATVFEPRIIQNFFIR